MRDVIETSLSSYFNMALGRSDSDQCGCEGDPQWYCHVLDREAIEVHIPPLPSLRNKILCSPGTRTFGVVELYSKHIHYALSQ